MPSPDDDLRGVNLPDDIDIEDLIAPRSPGEPPRYEFDPTTRHGPPQERAARARAEHRVRRANRARRDMSDHRTHYVGDDCPGGHRGD